MSLPLLCLQCRARALILLISLKIKTSFEYLSNPHLPRTGIFSPTTLVSDAIDLISLRVGPRKYGVSHTRCAINLFQILPCPSRCFLVTVSNSVSDYASCYYPQPQAWVLLAGSIARPTKSITNRISKTEDLLTVNNLMSSLISYFSCLRTWMGQWLFKGIIKFSIKEAKTWSGPGRCARQAPLHQARLRRSLVPQQREMSHAMRHHTAKS